MRSRNDAGKRKVLEWRKILHEEEEGKVEGMMKNWYG